MRLCAAIGYIIARRERDLEFLQRNLQYERRQFFCKASDEAATP